MKIGIIGDIHYPYRNREFPFEFLDWFDEEGVELVVGTGDYSSVEAVNYIKKRFHFEGVIGNTDDYLINLPQRKVIEIAGWRIGITHSKEIYPRGDVYKLYRLAREMNVNILIYGHTHLAKFEFVGDDEGGIYLLNPGSAGGVISGELVKPPKSAAILDISVDSINVEFKIIS